MASISDFLIYPSFYSLVITGLLILIILILFFKNFRSISNMESNKLISLLAIIAIVIGNHGILHGLFETRSKPNLDMNTFF
jgi:hypothetical protein